MGKPKATLDTGALGAVEEYEEGVNEAVAVLKSNVGVLTRLLSFYAALVKDKHFPAADRGACKQAVRNFSSQIEEVVSDHTMQISMGNSISKLISDRKQIVSDKRCLEQTRQAVQNLTASSHSSSNISRLRPPRELSSSPRRFGGKPSGVTSRPSPSASSPSLRYSTYPQPS